MAFTGGSYRFVFNGSFNGNENLDQIPSGDFAEGSRNNNTHNGGAEKRGGTQVVSTMPSAVDCLGLGYLETQAGSTYTYFAGNDGVIYRNGVSVKTGRSLTAKTTFTQIGDLMFICNGVDPVQVDTGSAIADIATPAADWSGTNQPTQIIVHGRGAARRAWAIGVAGKKDVAYYSSLGAFETFSGGTAGTVVIDTQDGSGLRATATFGENLLFFSRSRTYILTDDSPTTSTWGYQRAPWTGGAYSPWLVVTAPNDLIAMMEDGEVYSISRAEQIRDYKRASITRPFFIHNYISSLMDLTKIDDFHMAYDPKIQAVKIWMTRIGQTIPDVALPYYVFTDKWAPPHDAMENPLDSGYAARASCTVRSGIGEYKLYTGDSSGRIWELETVTKSDNGNAYFSPIGPGWLDFDLPRNEKRYVNARLTYITRGDYTVTFRWWLDDVEQSSTVVGLENIGATYGSALYGTSVYGVLGIAKNDVPLGNIGRLMKFRISNEGVGEDYFLSNVIIDFVDRGARAL